MSMTLAPRRSGITRRRIVIAVATGFAIAVLQLVNVRVSTYPATQVHIVIPTTVTTFEP
jgi:hypothetical protein